MRILDRYILRELLRTTAMTTGVLVTVTAFGAAIKPIAHDNLLTAGQTAKYIVLAIVPMLQFALPFAAGFAGTISMHRMTTDNEIIAAAAGGISYTRLLAPVAGFGLVLTLIMVLLTQWIVPRFWGVLENTAAADITRLFERSIDRGDAFKVGDQLIYADGIIVEPVPEDSEIDTRLTLLHVAAVALDSEGRIDKDVTANRAVIDVYRRADVTLISISMIDAVAYDPDGGVLAHAERLDADTIVIPNRSSERTRQKTRGELLALRRNSDAYVEIEECKQMLADALQNHGLWRRVSEMLGRDGEIELVPQRAGGGRYRLVADRLVGALFVHDDQDSIVVEQLDAGQPVRRFRAEEARLLRHGEPPGEDPRFDVLLRRCEVEDLGSGVANLREQVSLENVVIPGIVSEALADLHSSELLKRYEASDAGAAVEPFAAELIDELGDIQYEITGRLNKRYALSMTAILLLLLGVVLAMWLRESLPLTIYMLAFVPSIADLVVISSGEQMIRDGRAVLGTIVLWMGNVLLAAMLVWVFRKLARH